MSYETLSDFKSTIGYQIRFEKSKRSDTNVIFMTEGLLLRQASEEETLNSYDVIILDEVHERHLHGDFLIGNSFLFNSGLMFSNIFKGIMKCVLYKRKDLKLILMSATINIELFSSYFKDENIQVIEVTSLRFGFWWCNFDSKALFGTLRYLADFILLKYITGQL